MNLLIAIGLCVASSVAYAVAALLQHQLAGRNLLGLVKHPVGLIGLTLNGAGAVLHVAALKFGPLLVVQPLGLLGLVLAVLFAAARRRQRVGGTQRRGLALTCLGLTGLLALIDPTGARPIQPGQLPYLLAVVAVVLAGAAALGRMHPQASSPVAAAAAGVCFGVCSAVAQTVTVVLSGHSLSAYGIGPMTLAGAAIVALAAAGVTFTQVSFRSSFGPALAISTLVDPVAAAAIGVALLGEQMRWGWTGAAAGLACAALSARGILVMSQDPLADRGRPTKPLIPDHIGAAEDRQPSAQITGP